MCIVVVALISHSPQSPSGWTVHISDPVAEGYRVTVDTETVHGGHRAASIEYRGFEPLGWVTLMQTFNAEAYRGQRVRLSAFLKTANVDRDALLLMRVEGPGDSVLAFDNMSDRPIRGDRDWQRYEVVLDVPSRARVIAMGVIFEGWGHVWIDDVDVSVVGTHVPPTAPAIPARPRGRAAMTSSMGDRPANLDFEH
jgi:hypothetical protein